MNISELNVFLFCLLTEVLYPCPSHDPPFNPPSLPVCGCLCKVTGSAPQGMSPIFSPNGPSPTETELPWGVPPGMWSRELNQSLSAVCVLWWGLGVLLGAQPARGRVCIAVPALACPAVRCVQLQRAGLPWQGTALGTGSTLHHPAGQSVSVLLLSVEGVGLPALSARISH